MNKQDVIDYVLNSPHNTNPAVLTTMLNTMDNGQDYIQVQADWNQNDPIANDYVKNRTHYVEEIDTEVTMEISVNNVVSEDTLLTLYEQRATAKYVIMVNGGMEATYAGDAGNGMEWYVNIGASVYTVVTSFDNKRVVAFRNELGNYPAGHITYLEKTTIIHKLEAKYLPDEVQPDWNQNDPTANDYIKNRPFYENIISTVLIEANATENNLLPYTNFMFDKEYIIEFDGVRYPLRLTWQWDFNDGGYFVGFNVGSETAYGRPYKADSNIPFILSNYSFQNNFSGEISLNLRLFEPRDKYNHTIKIMEEKSEIKILDAKYLPNHTPYVIDSEAYTYGDDALAAILEGREILIKVPNKDATNTLYSNFMPVLQYQLPNENNNYLTLFYLKDGIAENILAAMQGAIQGDPSGFANLYGTIEMMLSQSYTECPLKVSPIK